MKRREFLSKSIFGSLIAVAAASVSGLGNKAMAAILWVTEGKLGYKSVAPANMVAAKKQCSTCSWYKADPKEKGAGLCTLVAMQSAMKSKEIHVKEGGFCPMWKKIS